MNYHKLLGYTAGLACGLALIGGGVPLTAHAMAHAAAHPASHAVAHTTTHTSPVHTETHAATHATTHETTGAKSTKLVTEHHAIKTGQRELILTKFERSATKSSKPIKSMTQSKQLKLVNSKSHYSKSAAARVFHANGMSSAYQTAYHHQSVIHNPWFWVFMMNHHRLNSQTQTDREYLAGYKLGVKEGQVDLNDHSRHHQNLTSSDEKKHSQKWQSGYYDGYNDAVTNNVKTAKATK